MPVSENKGKKKTFWDAFVTFLFLICTTGFKTIHPFGLYLFERDFSDL